MKTLLLIALFSAAVFCQASPCLVDRNAAAPAPEPLVFYPGSQSPAARVPEWQPRAAETNVYKIAAAGAWQIPVYMPVAGRCSIAFASYNDGADLDAIILDNLGRYITQRPKGEIEILIFDDGQLAAFNARRSYVARYSTGRVFDGSFDIDLAAGNYRLVINNFFSFFGAKAIILSLGGTRLDRKL